jgi:hypothetical protein
MPEGEVSEEENSAVSRRQFFRGVTGDFLRAIGELSGIDRLEEHLREPLVLTELDQMVSPERQATAMSEIFGFLEHLDVGKDSPPEHDSMSTVEEPFPYGQEPVAEHEVASEQDVVAEHEAPAEHQPLPEHDSPAS